MELFEECGVRTTGYGEESGLGFLGTHDGAPECERRRSPRISDSIFVFCHTQSLRPIIVEALTNDISGSGVSFDTTMEFPVGSLMEMEAYVPLDYYKRVIESVHILAKVVWQEKIFAPRGANQFRTGIEFVVIGKKEQEKLVSYIENGFVKR